LEAFSDGERRGGQPMKREKKPPEESYQIRCPRLGHQISFSFCQSENRGLPCFKTLDCWFEHFLVEEFLREKLAPEDWDKAFGRPTKSKMTSLLELIEQAKERKKEGT
jgi:hypothetical protein